MVSTQGASASAAQSLAEGQSIVTTNLEVRYEQSREVNIDEEMASLIELQTALPGQRAGADRRAADDRFPAEHLTEGF